MLKFGGRRGGRSFRGALWSIYHTPSDARLLPSLQPIADLTSKKRKASSLANNKVKGSDAMQTDEGDDTGGGQLGPVKNMSTDKVAKMSGEESEEESEESSDDDESNDDDSDNEELHDCDEDGGRRKKKGKRRKKKGKRRGGKRGKRRRKKAPNTVLLKKGSKRRRVRTIHALSRGRGKTKPTPVLIT